jgi:hypothetical protein
VELCFHQLALNQRANRLLPPASNRSAHPCHPDRLKVERCCLPATRTDLHCQYRPQQLRAAGSERLTPASYPSSRRRRYKRRASLPSRP